MSVEPTNRHLKGVCAAEEKGEDIAPPMLFAPAHHTSTSSTILIALDEEG